MEGGLVGLPSSTTCRTSEAAYMRVPLPNAMISSAQLTDRESPYESLLVEGPMFLLVFDVCQPGLNAVRVPQDILLVDHVPFCLCLN